MRWADLGAGGGRTHSVAEVAITDRVGGCSAGARVRRREEHARLRQCGKGTGIYCAEREVVGRCEGGVGGVRRKGMYC